MKKVFKLILLFSFLSSSVLAGELNQSFQFKSYEEAKKNVNQLKFTVVSTKVGLFSSDVDGYALKFEAKANIKASELEKMTIVFPSSALNTDGESRDEKLHELCLSAKKFPNITVTIQGKYNFEKAQKQSLPAIVNIRGKEKKTSIELEASSNGDFLAVSAKSIWKLSEMEIPDPSIAVAKLSDEIKIHVNLQLPLKK